MKFIKTLLLALILLISAALILALFIPKNMTAERDVVINKPKQEVFDYIKNLKNQNNFSKWAGMDPNMKKEFRGTDGTIGFVSAWDSDNKNVGKGEQEIKKIDEGNRIDYELRFIKPFESTATAYMSATAVDSTHTKVIWGFAGNMAYPFNIMRLFSDPSKMVGDDFSTGLNNLKAILEK